MTADAQDVAGIATAIRGAEDLYRALRGASAGHPPAPGAVAALIALLERGDATDRATAARLSSVDAGLLLAVMRAGAGLPPVPGAGAVVAALERATPAPVVAALGRLPAMRLPTGGQLAGMPAFSDRAFDGWFAAQGVAHGIGLYGEHRTVYATPQFADPASPERRTRRLGIDVFAPAGTPVHAPLAGRVAHLVYNADPLDYGHTLILQHRLEGTEFFTLYGHLGASLPGLLKMGDAVEAGQVIAHFGDWPENGGWAPHLHFQIITDLLEQRGGNFFGVGHAGLWDVWQAISPDPNLILRLPAALTAL